MESMTAKGVWETVTGTVMSALQGHRGAYRRVRDLFGNTEHSDG
jgi:hypothetical protein